MSAPVLRVPGRPRGFGDTPLGRRGACACGDGTRCGAGGRCAGADACRPLASTRPDARPTLGCADIDGMLVRCIGAATGAGGAPELERRTSPCEENVLMRPPCAAAVTCLRSGTSDGCSGSVSGSDGASVSASVESTGAKMRASSLRSAQIGLSEMRSRAMTSGSAQCAWYTCSVACLVTLCGVTSVRTHVRRGNAGSVGACLCIRVPARLRAPAARRRRALIVMARLRRDERCKCGWSGLYSLHGCGIVGYAQHRASDGAAVAARALAVDHNGGCCGGGKGGVRTYSTVRSLKSMSNSANSAAVRQRGSV